MSNLMKTCHELFNAVGRTDRQTYNTKKRERHFHQYKEHQERCICILIRKLGVWNSAMQTAKDGIL